MPVPRPVVTVLLAVVAALALGTNRAPLWDEDEPRFAAIARTMVETGDWVVPTYNGELAVDKPVLMHWCMAAAMTLFGTGEFACRVPSMIATLLTALALLRAGRRWFDDVVGVVAALAYTGSLLVAVEAHAATPDAILVALTTWATLLLAEAVLDAAQARAAGAAATTAPRLSVMRATVVGGLLGLAVVCKGPVGFVGPLAVIVPWAWWLAAARRAAARPAAESFPRRLLGAAPAAAWEVARELRPLTLTLAALAAALPWYAAVAVRTDGAWPAGFFLVHNVGRFVAPMERHGGGALFHPLALLVGFFPWSCFLPLALVVAGWRVARGVGPAATGRALFLLLVWLGVWLAAFSAAATKLPNYVLPAYPAAALVVAAIAVDAARRAAADAWPHPRWLAVGVASLALGGVATAAVVLVAARYGLAGAEGAALVGLVPVAGALAVAWAARRHPGGAVAALVVTGLVYTALAVGPAAGRLARANALPGFVHDVQQRAGGVRLGAYMLASPNVVFYAHDRVVRFPDKAVADAGRFLDSGPDAVLLLPEERLDQLRPLLPPGYGIVGRVRPLFRSHDVVAVGRLDAGAPRTAGLAEPVR